MRFTAQLITYYLLLITYYLLPIINFIKKMIANEI